MIRRLSLATVAALALSPALADGGLMQLGVSNGGSFNNAPWPSPPRVPPPAAF